MTTNTAIDEDLHGLTELATRLSEDKARLDRGLGVGDSGMVAPRLGGAEDKRTGMARRLARHLFPTEDAQRSLSYIRYGQLLSRLRRQYLEQAKAAQEPAFADNPYRMARQPGGRQYFEQLLAVPFSDGILHPSPMPVDVAPVEDLQPIFTHLTEGVPATETCVQFTRGAHSQDGRMDMCKQVVADRHIGSLVDSIRHNDHVRHFLIGNNIVGDAGATEISRLLEDKEASSALETLYLAGNCIGADGAERLAQALRNNRTVKSLWLKRNPLHVDGVRHIASLLEHNDTLETLDLVNTGLLNEGVEVLFASLRHNTTLRTLYVDANGITPVGAKHIAEYFAYLKTKGITGLTGLFLAVNRLGDEGAAIIAEAVRGYEHLVRLELSSNRIQRAGLQTVLQVAGSLPALRYLGLGLYKSTTDLGELPNYFDGDCADIIANFVRSNDGVQVMDLRDTNLRPVGLELIVEAMESNATLLHLYADQYGASYADDLRPRMDAILARNVSAAMGLDLQTFRSNPLRFIKHSENIQHIDSIYRNQM